MGSIAQLGFTYIQLFGHQKEEDYPYTSGTTMDTGACGYDYDANTPAVGIRGYNMLPSNDQEAVMTHLAEVGPLAVAVYASSWGSSWGEGGYIRLQRQSEAQCGTDSTPMDGSACEGGPRSDEQHVCGQCGVLFDTSYPLGAHDFVKP